MATRKFCDICDSNLPAQDYNRERRISAKMYGKDAKIVIRVVFGIEQHRTGWGGPPDICEKCFKKLVKERFR